MRVSFSADGDDAIELEKAAGKTDGFRGNMVLSEARGYFWLLRGHNA
jgi:hypothetical protein